MKLIIPLLFLLTFISSGAQTTQKKTCHVGKISGDLLVIDGKLDETVWESAEWCDDFIQWEPVDSGVASQKTAFAILYDEQNIYVGMKMFDTAPDSIVQRLTRRDQVDGDLAGVFFDSYNDKRTAFAFFVTASGVKYDLIFSNDGNNEDDTWNPIWWTKVSKDSLGWYAEMRIPFTQLRFEEKPDQEWGFQAARGIFRKDETSLWSPSSRKKATFVGQFGTITGLEGIQSRNIADIMPYTVAKAEIFEKEPENPFREQGYQNNLNVGLDAKIGLTNFLTLDLTVNPDFGQVEADPSEVNLTTYETFFQERRPFFIEGKNILNYGLNFGDGDLAAEGMFYSRRIGRSPHYYPDPEEGTFAKVPEFTRILGAAKISGKTANGWSVGLLESMTAKEYARIKGNNTDEKIPVEPFTNYGVARIQKDFDEGNTMIGGMITSVNRNLADDELNFLHKSAYAGGLDFIHRWHNKDWELDLSLYGSQVAGSSEAITRTQEAWTHLYQRPDAGYLGVDSSRTSLTGYGGKIVLAKFGGKLRFMHGLTFKSPGLELNDVGYLREADNILQVFWMGYRIFKPVFIFRELYVNFNQWTEWNFGGDLTAPGGNVNLHTSFTNYWGMDGGINISGRGISTSALRGGPALTYPGNYNLFLSVGTNDQKKLTFEVDGFLNRFFEKEWSRSNGVDLEIGYRPLKSLKLFLEPEYSFSKSTLQYVTQEEVDGIKRYIFGSIKRNTLSASVRINLNLTPDLSLEFWGQPFIATGEYSDFKRITNPKANEMNDRFRTYSASEIIYSQPDESYHIYEPGWGSTSFEKPDFNVKEFLSNMVLRWEYRPGSTVYLVWSQNRSVFHNNGSFGFSRDMERLFGAGANNILLVKLSYRLGR